MPYQGRQPGVGVRDRFIFTATTGQTSFSGNDSNGLPLKYDDATYVDVFINGTLLVPVTLFCNAYAGGGGVGTGSAGAVRANNNANAFIAVDAEL